MSDNTRPATGKDNSGLLFDELIVRHKLRNDAGLARKLGVWPPCISKIRHGRIAVSADIILRVHETLGMPVANIRALMTLQAEA